MPYCTNQKHQSHMIEPVCGVCHQLALNSLQKERDALKREREENDTLRRELEDANKGVRQAAIALGRLIEG